jgi:hypothetical protein
MTNSELVFDGTKISNVELNVWDSSPLHALQIVGSGDVTDKDCSRWLSMRGCLRVLEHERIGKLHGKDFKDMGFVQKVHHWCNDWMCPKCYRHGSSVRLARKIEGRFDASKQFGNVEHVIISSIHPRYVKLSIDAMYKAVQKALEVRGFIGGILIPHGFAKRKYEMFQFGVFRQIGTVWRFHMHSLSFLSGGYDHCRNCRKNGVVPSKEQCQKCGGFEFVTRKCNEKDDFIVKIAEDEKTGLPNERESIFGTAWYLLNHMTIKVGKVGVKTRSHGVRWWGCVSYRKLHVKVVDKKQVCPICKLSLYAIRYGGVRSLCLDVTSSRYEANTMEHVHEGGVQVWFKDEKKPFARNSVGGKPKSYGDDYE